MTRYANIASSLRRAREQYPYKRAVVCPKGRDRHDRVLYAQLTFTQLDILSDRLAFGFQALGITRGTRTILMVPPGMEFFMIIFALFKVGAVPVVVDPGMGIDRMVKCLKQGRPRAFIGIEKAHLLRSIKPKYFRRVQPTTWEEPAAIVFTTGSTGPAKGVVYSHGNFEAQIRQLQAHFDIGPDEIDLPTFPLFALFDPALGMTAVIPDMDPTKPAKVNPLRIIETKPAKVNPLRIIEAIENHGVTNMFASPALLNRVGSYGKEAGVKLPSLKRVVSAGAPVSPHAKGRYPDSYPLWGHGSRSRPFHCFP